MNEQNSTDKTVLVVAVRGWTSTGDRLLFGRQGGEIRTEFITALENALPSTEVWAPSLEMDMFSMRSGESISQELFNKISKKLEESANIESIILLGYSAGSLFVRRVFCMAHGATCDGKVVTRNRVDWADKIDRIVMLSGITRGWEFSSASPAHVRFFGPVLQKITSVVGWWKTRKTKVESSNPLIWQLKRGSPFVVATRIQYVNVFKELQRDSKNQSRSLLRVNGLPSTVFLLGAKDEFISPSDCTELGPRIEFAFIELSGSNHMDALKISGQNEEDKERLLRLMSAINDDFDVICGNPWSVSANDIDDYLDPMDISNVTPAASHENKIEEKPVSHAVMVVHGIRDNGFWTKRIAREIKTLGRTKNISVRAPTPSYGYFSMWDFIKPGGREQAAYWFMEQYANVKSHFPDAKISFVGHSNGTYIAARSIELCPAIKFENVVFAGSVVRRNFNWSMYPGQVHNILNFVGSGDRVVAFLPAVFELFRLRWLDVGGAGSFGFVEAEPEAKDGPVIEKRIGGSDEEPIKLNELRFIPGGHGAATEEEFWHEVAAFALLGNPPSRDSIPRKAIIQFLFRCAPVITVAGVIIALMLLTLPLTVTGIYTGWVITNTPPIGIAITGALGLALGSLFISWLVGRFLRMW
ncbi:MAG: hypothetical protein ACU88J_03545 [Gammaproteobacteria bacterium]